MFIDRLINRILSMKNHCIVGIDPHEEIIPVHIKERYYESSISKNEIMGKVLLQFSKDIIDNIYDIVAGIKPQIAFFERYGSYGIRAYEEVCNYAKEKELIVIADVKRGDIGSTAKAYSNYYLGGKDSSISVDAITINPYMGKDSMEPFVNDCKKNKKGIFVLTKTSNPSSEDIQNRICDNKRIYEIVGDLVMDLAISCIGEREYSSIGAVVGATHVEEGEYLRERMKNTYFLVPGYGAQGAKASDLAGFFNKDGLGAVINSSRAIIGAYALDKYKNKYNKNDYATAARIAAIDMRNEINKELIKIGKVPW